MKTLRNAKIGEYVTVVKLHGTGAVKRRIMDMVNQRNNALCAESRSLWRSGRTDGARV